MTTFAKFIPLGVQAMKDNEAQVQRMMEAANNLPFLKGKLLTPVTNQNVTPTVSNEPYTLPAYSQSSADIPIMFQTTDQVPAGILKESGLSSKAQVTTEVKPTVQTDTGIKGFIANTLQDPKKKKEYGIIAGVVIAVLIILVLTLKN